MEDNSPLVPSLDLNPDVAWFAKDKLVDRVLFTLEETGETGVLGCVGPQEIE